MNTTLDNSTVWQTKLLWVAVALLGAVAFAIVALNRGEAVNAAWLVTAALCIYFIAFRFYGLFVADRALGVDGARPTPAYRHNDGLDYVPTNRRFIAVIHGQFGKSPFAQDCVVGLGGLELLTKRLLPRHE